MFLINTLLSSFVCPECFAANIFHTDDECCARILIEYVLNCKCSLCMISLLEISIALLIKAFSNSSQPVTDFLLSFLKTVTGTIFFYFHGSLCCLHTSYVSGTIKVPTTTSREVVCYFRIPSYAIGSQYWFHRYKALKQCLLSSQHSWWQRN